MEQNELYKLVKDFREGRRYRILGYRVLNDDEKYDIANYIEDYINEYLNDEEYPDLDSVISDAIEGVDAYDTGWMFPNKEI